MWDKIKSYQFMGEGVSDWFLFLGVFIAIATVWRFILGELKRAV